MARYQSIEVEAEGSEAPGQTAEAEMDHDVAAEKSQTDWTTMPATSAIDRTKHRGSNPRLCYSAIAAQCLCAGEHNAGAGEPARSTNPSVNARAHTPTQDLGQEVDHRDQHDQQRNEQDDQAFDIGRHEEREIAVQEAGAEAMAPACIGRDRQ
jgi:hypothetical protein